jgi:hypothetical protein
LQLQAHLVVRKDASECIWFGHGRIR